MFKIELITRGGARVEVLYARVPMIGDVLEFFDVAKSRLVFVRVTLVILRDHRNVSDSHPIAATVHAVRARDVEKKS